MHNGFKLYVNYKCKRRREKKIDRALERFRRKTRDTKLIQLLRDQQQFTKKSEKRRKKIQQATLKQFLRDQEEN